MNNKYFNTCLRFIMTKNIKYTSLYYKLFVNNITVLFFRRRRTRHPSMRGGTHTSDHTSCLHHHTFISLETSQSRCN